MHSTSQTYKAAKFEIQDSKITPQYSKIFLFCFVIYYCYFTIRLAWAMHPRYCTRDFSFEYPQLLAFANSRYLIRVTLGYFRTETTQEPRPPKVVYMNDVMLCGVCNRPPICLSTSGNCVLCHPRSIFALTSIACQAHLPISKLINDKIDTYFQQQSRKNK